MLRNMIDRVWAALRMRYARDARRNACRSSCKEYSLMFPGLELKQESLDKCNETSKDQISYKSVQRFSSCYKRRDRQTWRSQRAHICIFSLQPNQKLYIRPNTCWPVRGIPLHRYIHVSLRCSVKAELSKCSLTPEPYPLVFRNPTRAKPNKLTQAVTSLASTREASGSNLARYTDCPDRRISCFHSVTLLSVLLDVADLNRMHSEFGRLH
jgi:hypothetical protein